MYSMVLMMAVTASPDAAAFGNGCGGCNGIVAGCNGCHGGLFGGKKLFNGCSGCVGSHASCFGGCGGKWAGCSGCFGGCGGKGLFGGGCCGMFSKKSWGCNGCSGGCAGCYGTAPATDAKPVDDKKPLPKEEKKGGGVTLAPAPAIITVNVPADAKVTIDGAATISTSSVRHFATPELQRGTVYYYTLTAEVVREGKSYTATEKVAVEAGSNPTITLNPNVGAAVASK